jgi:hypothetical protein
MARECPLIFRFKSISAKAKPKHVSAPLMQSTLIYFELKNAQSFRHIMAKFHMKTCCSISKTNRQKCLLCSSEIEWIAAEKSFRNEKSRENMGTDPRRFGRMRMRVHFTRECKSDTEETHTFCHGNHEIQAVSSIAERRGHDTREGDRSQRRRALPDGLPMR